MGDELRGVKVGCGLAVTRNFVSIAPALLLHPDQSVKEPGELTKTPSPMFISAMTGRSLCWLAACAVLTAIAPRPAVAGTPGAGGEASAISDFRLEDELAGPSPVPAVQVALAEGESAPASGADEDEAEAAPSVPLIAYGPPDGMNAPSASADPDRPDPAQYRGFGRQLGAVKWEMGAIIAYYTAINGPKLFDDAVAPHFHKEGWFGKSTKNLGMDKLAHAYSAYVLSDIIYGRLKRKTGDAAGIALTAAALGSATMLYTEFWDSIERSAGWSWEDVAFNSLGSGFSLLRNTVPGLEEKLDFRLMIEPNSDIITVEGKRHFQQQRYFFALKFAGFKGLERGPLRYLEFHAGYYGKDFTNEDRAAGVEPKRRLFVGVGINLRELFFKDSRSRVGRAVGEGLGYFQPPYTVLHTHLTN